MDYCSVEYHNNLWTNGNRTILFVWCEREYAIDYSIDDRSVFVEILEVSLDEGKKCASSDEIFHTWIFDELIADTNFCNSNDVEFLETKMLKYAVRVLREMSIIEHTNVKKAN